MVFGEWFIGFASLTILLAALAHFYAHSKPGPPFANAGFGFWLAPGPIGAPALLHVRV
jgi:hypothetical protein